LENGSAIEEGDDEDQELELEIGNPFSVYAYENMCLISLLLNLHRPHKKETSKLVIASL